MAYGEVQDWTPTRRRWGRRILIALLVLFLVVGLIFVVADRVGASIAEQRITEEVSQQLDARGVRSSPPDVSVGGFPFLTQVLAETYKSISIVLRDVSAQIPQSGQAPIQLPRLDIEAREVNAPIDTLRTGQGDIVAKTVEGTATVGYTSVEKWINQPGLRLSENDGKLTATLPVEVYGQRITLTGAAEVSAIKDGIRLKFDDLTAEGLPQTAAVRSALRSAVRRYADNLSVDVDLPALPFGIQVRQVTPLPEGLAVTAGAQNVPLNRAVG